MELYIDSPSPQTMISHHIKGIPVLYSYTHCVIGLRIVWTLIDRLDHVYRGSEYTVYLLDGLVESHTAQLLLGYYCTRMEVSVIWEGGGGGWLVGESFFHYTFFAPKNVPGTLKRK